MESAADPSGDGPAQASGAGVRDRLHGDFRPARGRLVATWTGAGQGAIFVSVAVLTPSLGPLGFHWYDRLGLVLVGAAIGTLLWRFARLAVLVRPAGIVVRNLAGDHPLVWAQVVSVRFGDGQPWVTLDLADGESFPVMAIQRADGAFGTASARRLATLIALHTQTDRNT